MARVDVLERVRIGAALAAGVVMLCAVGAAAGASPLLMDTARNQNNFTLKIDDENFTNGNWSGDGEFSISACDRPSCFHLSGSVKLPRSRTVPHIYKGAFPIAGSPCELYFEEVDKNGMDSGDWRIQAISADKDGRGCASLPAGLTGVYREVPAQSGYYKPAS